MKKLSVIDFFCGAGGFSEGFRQQGFDIVYGVDSWQPAVDTFNHNFGLNCTQKNILDFNQSTDEIEALPDTDVIIGSPPCVSFSSSNNSGKADKRTGITLTLVFLKIVAIKKWKKDSILKAWYMENVPNSIKHLASEFTFEELGLSNWAMMNKIAKKEVAISLKRNHKIINSADYGSFQARKRVISGEVIKGKKLILPHKTHSNDATENLLSWKTLQEFKNRFPKPSCKKSSRKIKDPNYPQIQISLRKLSDHFYDSGIYECQWRQTKFLKMNHPYMGIMSFPEKNNKPSRTITATNIVTSRETMIFRSEFKRLGNGEYRTLTVREAACLMGFPITFQFIGSEGTKWRLIGNAVCPSISKAFAKELLVHLEFDYQLEPHLVLEPDLRGVNCINTYAEKDFLNLPKRTKGSRFRRHPFKDGFITVTLSNYDIEKNEREPSEWITSVQYGNGKGFPIFKYSNNLHLKLEPIILESFHGKKFHEIINNGFSDKIANSSSLQSMYERQKSNGKFLEPTQLIEELASIIEDLGIENMKYFQNDNVFFKNKTEIPLKQLFALYAINFISSTANGR